MAVGVPVTLEAFQDVVATAVAGRRGGAGSGVRAGAATAEEEHRRLRVYGLLQLGEEIFIAPAAGVGVPFDLGGAGDAAHPVLLGPGADVDETGAGGVLQDIVGLLRRQRAGVGKAQGLGAFPRQGKDFGKFSHGSQLLQSASSINQPGGGAEPAVGKDAMGKGLHHHHDTHASESSRHRLTRRSTWVSVAVNLVLVVGQVGAGLVAHSQSLVADGLHSLSDMVCDFIVLLAAHHSRNPADLAHPYGHGRYETAASLALGVILALTGGGIIYAAAMKLQNLGAAPPVGLLALWIALVALVAKEGLFRYMLRIGERLRSPMLVANAWHARSDAASSLVVAAGIGGSLAGFAFADSVAAVIVGFMIVRMGVVFAWEALQELIDAGLDLDQVDAIRQTIVDTPGVLGLHELRTRRMAQRALVDAHVQVDPRISVSEGHRIAESARSRVLKAHAAVLDVLVHIDPEDDLDPDEGARRMPARAALLAELDPLLAGLPKPRRVVLHYLRGRVEAEVFLDHDSLPPGTDLVAAQQIVSRRLAGHRYFDAVSLNGIVAPN